MGTIRESPRQMPPELRDLTLADLQEHMTSTVRDSLFLDFATLPECVGITLRREVGGYFWDIKIDCAYYHDTADPADRFTLYFWDVYEAEDYMIALDGNREGHESPEEAYAAALSALPALAAEWAEEAETKASTERFLMADPAETA